jgi:hypothetical protein
VHCNNALHLFIANYELASNNKQNCHQQLATIDHVEEEGVSEDSLLREPELEEQCGSTGKGRTPFRTAVNQEVMSSEHSVSE